MFSLEKDDTLLTEKRTRSVTSSASPIPTLNTSKLRDLQKLFAQSGYIGALEMFPSSKSIDSVDLESRLGLLINLFNKGEKVAADKCRDGIDPINMDTLIEEGLIEESNGQVNSLYQVQVYSGLLFIADFMPLSHPPDLVLPIGPSGKYLASVTIRRPINSALDLGCGCGIQSMLLARHAKHVVATDINPRAIALTRLNAVINGFSNIEVLEGSYFEPVHGMTFDLIVANLPYVITPENKYIYRDISEGGDNSVRQTVQEIPAYLKEGGYAHLMLNWVHREDQPWWEPVEVWMANHNADAWLLFSTTMTPDEYANRWILINERERPDEFAEVKEAWLKWYREQGIERISFGTISIRRRTSSNNWRCSVYVNKTASEPLGGQIFHLFESQDYLNSLKQPGEILKKKLQPWNLKLEPLPTGHYLASSSVGYILQIRIRPESAYVIAALDGKNQLKDIIQKTARDNHLPQSSFQDRVVKDFYQLINFGLIAPVH